MSEDELELIRQKRLQELQALQAQRVAQEEQARQVETQRQLVLRQILTPEARERLANLRMARPDIVAAVEDQLLMLVQSGRITQVIDDAALRQVLRRIVPRKREIKIERR